MIKVNITQDCSDADLSHIETLKQIAINSYKDNGIYLSKIRVSRLGDRLYAYHRYAMPRSYKKKIIVEDTATYTKFYRKNCTAYSDWLPINEEIGQFENYLNMQIFEALIRKGGDNR